MNRVFIPSLFFLLFFYVSAYSQNKKEKKEVKSHRIKTATEMVTETENGKEVTRKDSYTAYDKDANIIEIQNYRKDGTLKHKGTTKYDSKGNKIEETIFDAAETQPKPEKNVKHISKYDGNNNKIEDLEYDGSEKLIRKIQYSYNSKGDKILEVEFDATAKLIKKTVYIYDSKGLRVEKKEYDGTNLLISDRKYTYTF